MGTRRNGQQTSADKLRSYSGASEISGVRRGRTKVLAAAAICSAGLIVANPSEQVSSFGIGLGDVVASAATTPPVGMDRACLPRRAALPVLLLLGGFLAAVSYSMARGVQYSADLLDARGDQFYAASNSCGPVLRSIRYIATKGFPARASVAKRNRNNILITGPLSVDLQLQTMTPESTSFWS